MLRLGCAKVDVIPDFPVFLHGYGARNQRADGIESPVEVGVLALEQDGRRVLLVTADMIGVFMDTARKIYAALEAKFGIAYPDIWLSCSHSHFCPALAGFGVTAAGGLELGWYPQSQEHYFEFWMERLERCVEQALGSLREVTLEQVTIPVSGIAFNRRPVNKATGLVETNYTWPRGKADKYDFQRIDETFSVWRFLADGKPVAILGRYSCHPVTGGQNQYAFSGDYPGYFKAAVQRLFGCPGFFLLGTAGDVVPMRRNGDSREDLGETLARAIRLNELRFRPAPEFRLETKLVEVPCHISRLDNYDRSQREARWQAALAAASRDPKAPYNDALAAELYRYDISARYPDTVDPAIPIQLLRLGDSVLVGIPFEPLSQVGLAFNAACPNGVLVSLTGGQEGYLALASQFPHGGYETERGSDFAPGTGDAILAAAIQAVRDFQ